MTEEDINPLLEHFKGYLELDANEALSLRDRTNARTIKRRQFILQAGDICTHYTFVVNGCLKMYKSDARGNEHNLQFAIENEWITDIGSFHSEKKSELYIEALEQSQVFQIAKPDLLYLYVNHPKFDRNFRVIIEDAYVELQERVLQNIGSSAEERYLNFLDTYPNLFNRISNVQIASYLGVTPEFLSKIRKKITAQ